MLCAALSFGAKQIPLKVENASPGAPLTLGIPFPIGELHSPDQVRVLNKNGIILISKMLCALTLQWHFSNFCTLIW